MAIKCNGVVHFPHFVRSFGERLIMVSRFKNSTLPVKNGWLPWVVLMLLATGLFLFYRKFISYSLISMPDSSSFQEWDITSWDVRLSSMRTPGYPLFLSVIQQLGETQQLPSIQFFVHVMAVLAFYFGLHRFGVQPWAAFSAAAPLLFLPMIRAYGHILLSDAPALSLAIGSVGSLFMALGNSGRWWPWVGVGVTVTATWMVRPMYLFLVPLLPMLAVILGYISRSRHAMGLKRLLLTALLATLLPVILFSALRGVVVGHFGVVSFGGINVAGVATPLLTEGLTPTLPEELQPLARAIMVKRRELGLGYPFSPQGLIRYNTWYNEYNLAIHDVALPVAHAMTGDMVQANRELSRLSLAILVQRPFEYGAWISRSMVEAVLTCIRQDYGIQGLAALWLLMWLTRLVTRRRAAGETPQPAANDDGSREMEVVAVTGLLFFLAGTLEVVLVEPPIERYVLGTGALLVSVLGMACYRQVKPQPGWDR